MDGYRGVPHSGLQDDLLVKQFFLPDRTAFSDYWLSKKHSRACLYPAVASSSSMNDETEIAVDVAKCPRCGDPHPDLRVISSATVVTTIADSEANTTLIATCPKTGQKFEIHGSFEKVANNG